MEALKQLEVGKAIERLLEQDQEHRLVLAENLQKRMTNAEIRKRRREQDHWRVSIILTKLLTFLKNIIRKFNHNQMSHIFSSIFMK